MPHPGNRRQPWPAPPRPHGWPGPRPGPRRRSSERTGRASGRDTPRQIGGNTTSTAGPSNSSQRGIARRSSASRARIRTSSSEPRPTAPGSSRTRTHAVRRRAAGWPLRPGGRPAAARPSTSTGAGRGPRGSATARRAGVADPVVQHGLARPRRPVAVEQERGDAVVAIPEDVLDSWASRPGRSAGLIPFQLGEQVGQGRVIGLEGSLQEHLGPLAASNLRPTRTTAAARATTAAAWVMVRRIAARIIRRSSGDQVLGRANARGSPSIPGATPAAGARGVPPRGRDRRQPDPGPCPRAWSALGARPTGGSG